MKRSISGACLSLVLASLLSAGTVHAQALDYQYDISPTTLTLNGTPCPHIFVRGTDGGLKIAFECLTRTGLNPWTWGPISWFTVPTPAGQSIFPLGDISAVSFVNTDIQAFFRDSFQRLTVSRRLNNWQWEVLGNPVVAGQMLSVRQGPVAVTWNAGGVDKVAVFIVGSDGNLWMLRNLGSFWGSWINLQTPPGAGTDGLSNSHIAAALYFDGTLEQVSVFAPANLRLFEQTGIIVNGTRVWNDRGVISNHTIAQSRPGAVVAANGANPTWWATVGDNFNTTLASLIRTGTTPSWVGGSTGALTERASSWAPHSLGGRLFVPWSRTIATQVIGSSTNIIERIVTSDGTVTENTIGSGDNAFSRVGALYRGAVDSIDGFVMTRAGELMHYDGLPRTWTNFHHP